MITWCNLWGKCNPLISFRFSFLNSLQKMDYSFSCRQFQVISITIYTAIFNSKDIFITSFIVLLQGFTEQQGTQEDELDVVLKSWSFRRVEVSGDGKCLFRSIAHSLIL